MLTEEVLEISIACLACGYDPDGQGEAGEALYERLVNLPAAT